MNREATPIGMSSSFGKAERAISDALVDAEYGRLTVDALAERVGVSVPQILRVVQALEERGRVFIRRENLTSEATSTSR
jgi:DNA-binding MurR/RpiR family transcriptional regulator